MTFLYFEVTVTSSTFIFASLAWLAAQTPAQEDLWSQEKAHTTNMLLTRQVRVAEDQAIKLLSASPDAKLLSPKAAVFDAIEFLGNIRSTKAADVLAKKLLLEKNFLKPEKLTYRLPAAAALVKIGRPAVLALSENIVNSDTDVAYRRAALAVMTEILGKEDLQAYLDAFIRKNSEKMDGDAEEACGRVQGAIPEGTE